jgi:hypothetical protein
MEAGQEIRRMEGRGYLGITKLQTAGQKLKTERKTKKND